MSAARDTRLALIGDVHGNAAALRAVLAAVADAGIARGVNAGDLVMRGTHPRGAIRLIRATGWPTVIGNTDQKVGRGNPRPVGHPASERPGSRSWTIRRLDDEQVEWLADLPDRVELDVGGFTVLVTHGHPGDLSVVPDVDTPATDLVRIAKKLRVDAVVTGHTHRPFARRHGGTLFVNPGSVGEGTKDDLRPSWAWLEAKGGRLVAHLERVDEPLAPPRSA
ncbi:MAG: metallophosphoesterase family protein [Thermoleophilia bacterium]|nr:metallophosphoesterase family protein [Thermoleophilia bacterium]